jgi:hypothetical integral membrane protein (TIGR02206 family)
LAVLIIATVAAVLAARRYPGPPTDRLARALAALIIAAWAGEYIADLANGSWSLRYTLPLQLTDVVSLSAALALITRRALFVELVYFWSLTATLQATLTPDLGQSFPSVYYFTYFTYHIGAIVAGCMLVFGCRLYPRPGAAWRVFVLTLVWAAVAGAADLITGGNYMYMRAKPVHNSLLALMGPWPWYIASTVALALAMLLALQWITDLVARGERWAPIRQTPRLPR